MVASKARGHELTVLVVYVNFAVATAVSQRLLDLASVELARPHAALAHLGAGRRYDIVVICPYISPTERERVLERCYSRAGAMTQIDLLDTEDGLRVEVCDCNEARDDGVSVLHSRRSRSIDAVIASLSAPARAGAAHGRSDTP